MIEKNCAKFALMSRSIILLSIAVTSPFDVVHRKRLIIGLDRLDLAVSHVNDAVCTLCNVSVMRNENDCISVFR